MNPLLQDLEAATLEQFNERELPQWLADPVLEVARKPEKYGDREYLVEMLLAQVREYDVYADTGCGKWAYDHEDLKRTLGWLKEGE
ncbi:GSU3529 family protein [Trichloromonas sp.]|uniref:GSU3529 family protein n=1 Tax=Trichloromonas sp. TaxID=3069249 RepID=UPI002A3BEE47|nr:hypothetical protein [Trichloromonas sp.]